MGSNIDYSSRQKNTKSDKDWSELCLYARYLCSREQRYFAYKRDTLGLKAGRSSEARDDRVSCIQELCLHQAEHHRLFSHTTKTKFK